MEPSAPQSQTQRSNSFLVFCLAGLACSAEPKGPVEPERPPDVLLAVLDTVRADRLQAWGYSRPIGLQVGVLAEQGVRWATAHAPGSWTWPVHASLFTGTAPWVHGAHFPELDAPPQEGFPTPRPDLPTLAERFAAAGYRTVSLSANCLLTPELGLMRGFEHASCLDVPGGVEQAVETELSHATDKPLFLVVNLMPAHGPYSLTPLPWARPHAERLQDPPPSLAPYIDPGPPPGVDLQRRDPAEPRTGVQRVLSGALTLSDQDWGMINDLYDGEVVDADRRLMRILTAWTESPARADSIVAVTSDHGEHLGERGLVDHRGSVWPEITHVPLVITAPGRLPAGATVDRPVSIVAVADTLLTLAGVEPLYGSGLLNTDGTLQTTPTAPVMAMAWPDPYRSRALGGRWSESWMMWTDGDDTLIMDSAETRMLFDGSDTTLVDDLAQRSPERLGRVLKRAREDFGDQLHTGAPRAPAASTRAQLEALGYIQTSPSPATGENPR